jgi:hypothetical protein
VDAFVWAVRVTHAYCAAADVPATGLQDQWFEICPQDPANQFDCPYAVGGKTRYAPPRVAVLLLALPRFDWPTHLAVPYVLLHECLIHGVDGTDGGAPDHYGDGGAFAEGWMDAVVALVIRRALTDESPTGLVALGPPGEVREVATVADAFHRARMAHGRRNGRAARWLVGHQAFDQLYEALRAGAPHAEAEELAIRFSVAVNGSTASHLERDALVYALWRALPLPGAGVHAAATEPVSSEAIDAQAAVDQAVRAVVAGSESAVDAVRRLGAMNNPSGAL